MEILRNELARDSESATRRPSKVRKPVANHGISIKNVVRKTLHPEDSKSTIDWLEFGGVFCDSCNRSHDGVDKLISQSFSLLGIIASGLLIFFESFPLKPMRHDLG